MSTPPLQDKNRKFFNPWWRRRRVHYSSRHPPPHATIKHAPTRAHESPGHIACSRTNSSRRHAAAVMCSRLILCGSDKQVACVGSDVYICGNVEDGGDGEAFRGFTFVVLKQRKVEGGVRGGGAGSGVPLNRVHVASVTRQMTRDT